MTGLRFVVAGGGTGGHVTPALALGERIAARGDAVLFLGGERGLEGRLVPEAGFELVKLPARQVMGKGMAARLAALPDIARACARARRVLAEHRADVVVSVGGYAAVPAVVAAALSRVPVALVEPNAIPGRTNRYSARLARRIFVQFDEAAERLGGAGERVRNLGIPLRAGMLEAFASREPRRRPTAPLRLLVFGGSQGARQLNDAMLAVADRLAPGAFEIFHQTGEADRERVAAGYAAAGARAEVVAFERDMPGRYRWADVALCRSGALTVAELELSGLPSLLVPYPYAADDHQAANARALAAAGAARAFDPRGFDGEALLEALRDLQPETLQRMGEAAAKRARPDAAERIVEECAALVRGAAT